MFCCHHYFSGLDWAVCRLFLYSRDAISFQLDIFYFLRSHYFKYQCTTSFAVLKLDVLIGIGQSLHVKQ